MMYQNKSESRTLMPQKSRNNINFSQEFLTTINYFLLDSSNSIEKYNESSINERNIIFLRYYDDKKNCILEKIFKIEKLEKL